MARVKRTINDLIAIRHRQTREQAHSAARNYRRNPFIDDEASWSSSSSFSSSSSSARSSSPPVVAVYLSAVHRSSEKDIEPRCSTACELTSDKIRKAQRKNCKRHTYNCKKVFHGLNQQIFYFSPPIHLHNVDEEAKSKPHHFEQCSRTLIQKIDLRTQLLNRKHCRKEKYLKNIQK